MLYSKLEEETYHPIIVIESDYMAEITIRKIKPGVVQLDDKFWQILANLPKFRKIGRFTQLT